MNAYEKKMEQKRERLEERASQATTEADATYKRANDMSSAIPFGQPIHVGHYSEGRDRNYRKRIHNTYAKAFELQDKAEELKNRADAIGTGGISSDDPDAIVKLEVELANVLASQEKMINANKAVRRNDFATLHTLGFSEEEAAELLKGDFCGRRGFAAYALSNNRANARRIEQRIKELKKQREAAPVEQEANGYTYREDIEDNRIWIVFPAKPDESTRAMLKRHAFNFSFSRTSNGNSVYVRKLTANARYSAKCVRKYLDEHAA